MKTYGCYILIKPSSVEYSILSPYVTISYSRQNSTSLNLHSILCSKLNNVWQRWSLLGAFLLTMCCGFLYVPYMCCETAPVDLFHISDLSMSSYVAPKVSNLRLLSLAFNCSFAKWPLHSWWHCSRYSAKEVRLLDSLLMAVLEWIIELHLSSASG